MTVKLEIRRPDKDPQSFDIDPGVYSIGSDEDAHLRLSHDDVESRHAVLTIRDEGCWVEDLDAAAGTFLNQERISGRREVRAGEVIGVGPFGLVVHGDGLRPPEPVVPPVEMSPVETPPVEAPVPQGISASSPLTVTKDSSGDSEIHQRLSVKQQIHKELVKRLDIKRLAASRINAEELEERARATVATIVGEVSSRLPASITPEALIKEVCDEALRLGPLEEFLEDEEITEIMVNGHANIYVERKGKVVRVPQTFMDDASVMAIIERIVSPIGRRIDESQPYVDARLPDGSRVNAVIHPLSLIGPCLTIRKFSKVPFTDQDLIRFGTMIQPVADFCNVCVKMRKNIVVSGGTGSGKTSLLNVLSNYLPSHERIVTIEDAAELRLGQDHVVRLEARPPNIEGKGAITIRNLVRNALRMRPDRIVVGECRGGEALDMLQAMNTGHDGSLTTVHANSPRDVISRLETMVLMSGMDLPVRAIREQIASAVDMVVHESRFSDGSRKVTKVTEIVGLEGDRITMQDIFEYVQTGIDPDGNVIGHFRPTGSVPTFIEDIDARGLDIDRTMFDPQKYSEGGS